MNIYSILQLCGGLAFFLFGMHVMSGSLEKLAGGNLQKILKGLTSNPAKSLFFGAVITIAIQSSSALTVMLVGLVNSGIMELGQTVGVIGGTGSGKSSLVNMIPRFYDVSGGTIKLDGKNIKQDLLQDFQVFLL